MNSHTGNRLRKANRVARRTIPLEFQHYAAQRVCDALLNDAVFRRAKHVAFYVAVDGELSPAKIALVAENLGKQAYLPLISDFIRPWETTRLLFQPYSPRSSDLVQNEYGIPEPPNAPKCAITPAMLDLVILPLVAFDAQLNRLGMGKGYYDRTFGSTLRWRRPRLLGLGYASQQVERLESTSLDVPLDGILTEEGITWRGSNAAGKPKNCI